MSGSRIAEMDPRCTLEQFSLLTRLLSIGERLDQTGLPMDSMFQAIYNMEQSYCLGEKLPASGTAPLQVFTHDQHILLTRQLAIHQRLQETGLSDDSIIYSLFTMQMKTGNIDIDELQKIHEGEESADEGKEGAEVAVIPNTDTSAEPMTAEEIKIEVDRLMGQRQSHCRCHQHRSE
ncbi:Hypp4472 [Branchiostoma lanceolatum]|uniref:Hypp4472 protein n=1 Tax=Branchiostoma lanceolatum TaxID=7740 RepID=A0A8K0A7S3_BRALA|nr:Hypp4472 [Branchiostoma lanceolatum]